MQILNSFCYNSAVCRVLTRHTLPQSNYYLQKILNKGYFLVEHKSRAEKPIKFGSKFTKWQLQEVEWYTTVGNDIFVINKKECFFLQKNYGRLFCIQGNTPVANI